MNDPESYTVRSAAGAVELSPSAGYVLPHEHLILDLRVWWEGEGAWDALDDDGQGVVAENLFGHRHVPQGTSRENLVLSDWYLAAVELRKARSSGCMLLVDLTTAGLNPEPTQAVRAAGLAGVPIVLSVGRYIDPALSPEQRERSADDLADEWTQKIQAPEPGREIGMIGEIGTSAEVTDAEHRSLRAAALTQQATGLPINIHLHPTARQGHTVLDSLESAGANLEKVALSHCDAALDVAHLASLAERGCYVEFDLFGTDHDWVIEGHAFSNDEDRVRAIGELVGLGHQDHVLMSHDICMKNELTRYGGWGYGHLGATVLPRLRALHGEDLVTTLSSRNPLRYLAIKP